MNRLREKYNYICLLIPHGFFNKMFHPLPLMIISILSCHNTVPVILWHSSLRENFFIEIIIINIDKQHLYL